MLAVLDSGVWISALRFAGTPLKALLKASFVDQLACCGSIEEEVGRILRVKFAWQSERTSQAMNIYLASAQRVVTTGAVKGVCRDPKDDMILECASLVNADFVVTGDRDLLILRSYAGTKILTPRQYLEDE